MAVAVTNITFDPPLPNFLEARRDKPLTVLAGPNNSGKSLVLKWIKSQLGRTAYMVGANRFYHIYLLSSMLRDPRELDSFEQQFTSQFHEPNYNYEQNYIDLGRILGGLTDARRNELFDQCSTLLETPFQLRMVEPSNDLSMRYVEVGGQNISVASSGARLLLTLLGICMDERFTTILIDEPELGLSPRVQERLAALMQDDTRRRTLFPHLDNILLSTHSHLFLSRRDFRDNFVVAKDDLTISLTQVETTNDYHRLQFNLLGNSLESLFLPAAIVVVEGKSDLSYVDRVIQLRFPDRRVTVISGAGDVKRKIHGLREAFGDLSKSPFRSRLFVILDSVHERDLALELESMGVRPENIVTWDNNGIEYVYPDTLLHSCERSSQDAQISLSRETA